MYIGLPNTSTGACAAEEIPVYRVWDNRGDSNHRYTTDLNLRKQMVDQGWVAEGYGPTAVIMCAPPTPVAAKGQLLIQAWNPDGTVASVGDFDGYTRYVTGKWSMNTNYGAFPMGRPPATPQVGSFVYPFNRGGANYIALDVPADQPYYFTALWKAPVIGTVYMRADNSGAGLVSRSTQPQKLELPYDFAVAEFQQAQALPPAGALSAQSQALLSQAANAVSAVRNATSPAARAVAAYGALSYVMPLKERLVMDASNQANAATGRRADFDLNYEGFGSWTDGANAAGYAIAKDAGFKSVYTVVDWTRTSLTQGAYDFSLLDYQVDQAVKLGFHVALQVNPSFGNLPAWAKVLSFNELKSLYRENARTVVARYGSKISLYYACGEMELVPYPLTLGQVAELARQSLDGARTAAPATPFGLYMSASAYVSYQMNPGPGAAAFYSGLDLLDYLNRSNTHFDFLGLEMQYGTVFAPLDLHRFQQVLKDVYSVAKIPIYMGETGYSSKSEDYGIPASSHWHDGHTQQAQYEWADGTLRTLYALSFVKGYYWVHLDPDNSDQGSGFLSALVGTNLVRADGSVKKVRSAFKDFTTGVSGLSAR